MTKCVCYFSKIYKCNMRLIKFLTTLDTFARTTFAMDVYLNKRFTVNRTNVFKDPRTFGFQYTFSAC